jgi:hypothetical protein
MWLIVKLAGDTIIWINVHDTRETGAHVPRGRRGFIRNCHFKGFPVGILVEGELP